MKKVAITAGILALVIFAWFALTAGFQSDDYILLTRHDHLWWPAVKEYLSRPDWEAPHYFRPATRIAQHSLMAVMGDNPTPYHARNLVLHLISCLLVYRLARLLGSERNAARWGAGTFAILPMHAEPVVFATAIGSMGEAVCYLGAMCLFAAGSALTPGPSPPRGEGSRARSVASGVLTLIACLFKESGVTIPLTLAALWWMHDRPRRGTALVASSITAVAVYFLWRSMIGMTGAAFSESLVLNPLAWIRNLVFYIAQMILPLRSIFHWIGYENYDALRGILPIIPEGEFAVVVGVLGIALAWVGVHWWKKCDRSVQRAIILFLVLIAPLLAFRFTGMRLVYIASAGFAIGAGMLIARLRGWMRGLAYAWLIVMSVALVDQGQVWQQAGELADRVLSDAAKNRVGASAEQGIVYGNIPARLNGAFVLHRGFVEGVRWKLHDPKALVFNASDPDFNRESVPPGSLWLSWTGQRFLPLDISR